MSFLPGQIAAGLALARKTMGEFAEQIGMEPASISRIDHGVVTPKEASLRKIRDGLDALGVVITLRGVELIERRTRVYEGIEGYKLFCDDRYTTALHDDSEQLFCGGRQDEFIEAVGKDYFFFHAERMATVPKFHMRALKPESDVEKSYSPYIEYRIIPDSQFFSVPFYVYGSKLAIVTFNPDILVFVIHHKAVVDAYRQQFELQWQAARALRRQE